ncbi:MAG: hypothetical protein J6Y93_03555 [Treponema sp.]|nr:hypothetical protein [Treponema sp.]
MAKNNLSDLNNHLFATLEMLEDDELDDAELEKEIKRAKAVVSVSSQILNVARVQVSAIKTAESCGLLNKDMPALLATKDSKSEVQKHQKLLEAVR